MNSKQTKPNIVFAHGLWADGSCFSKLIPKLQAEGHEVVAAQTSPESSVRFEPIEILTGHGERVQTSGRDDGKSPLSQLAQQGRIK